MPEEPCPLLQNAARAGEGDGNDGSAGVDGGAESAQPEWKQAGRAHERAFGEDQQQVAVPQPPADFVGAGQAIAEPGLLNREVFSFC